MATKDKSVWDDLRKPFPKEVVGLLPKVNCYNCAQATKNAKSALDKHCEKHSMIRCEDCGAYITAGHIHLDYVGHAAVTDRLNSACGPENWDLTPLSADDFGNPRPDAHGDLWFTLRIFEAKRLCVGDGPTSKEIIGDALRNGAMRFGVALDLWSKEELESTLADQTLKNEKPTASLPAKSPSPAKATPSTDEPASTAQKAMITGLLKQQGVEISEMEGYLIETIGIKTGDAMTSEMAKFAIETLKSSAKEKPTHL